MVCIFVFLIFRANFDVITFIFVCKDNDYFQEQEISEAESSGILYFLTYAAINTEKFTSTQMTNNFDDIFEEIFPIESVKNYEEGNYASETDEISPEQVNLKSFDEKDTLCPSVFNLKTGDLKKVIRKRLIKIARDFISNIDEFPEIRIYDIILVGSLAQFNWSKYSDVDLHVVVDYSKLSKYGTKETL